MNRKIIFIVLAFFFSVNIHAQNVSIIPLGSSWKYLDNGSNQSTAWRGLAFDDAAWSSGNAQLGYGDGDESTIVSYGPSTSSKYITTYFRKTFSVVSPAGYSSFTLSLLRDDGAVVYLNGAEVLRSNMPAGIISYTTRASKSVSGIRESTLYSFAINASSFVSGSNVLSVEIHQSAATSDDISFNLKLDAVNAASCGTPGSLGASSITASSAVLSWSAVSGASGYNVQYSVFGTSSWTTVISTTTSKTISGLIPGTNYEFRVQAVCSVAGSYSGSFSFTTTSPLVTRGAYLQKLTPNSVTVRWRTNVATDSKVLFGTSIIYGSNAFDAALTTDHNLTINGLLPATNYFYAIGTSALTLQGDIKNNFYSAPVTGSITPVRIWAIGDFGNGSSAQTAVRDAYVNYAGSTPTNVWLWLGDNAYTNGTDTEFQNYVFAVYPDQFKSFPLFPSPGNHDYGTASYQSSSALTTNFPYYSIFSVPQSGESGGVASGSPKYYSFNYANIHFISLDSYGAMNTPSSPMYVWLNSDLAANTQRWTVVYFHHPPYTKGSHNSDVDIELINMRTNIVPLLESYHVDVVLCGHSHVNERSYLMKGHFGLASTFTEAMKVSAATNSFVKSSPFDGTVYAVCGTSGGSGSLQADAPMPCMYYTNNSNYCSLVMDVNGDNLSCKYLTSTGAIADQFSIVKVGARHAGGLIADQPESFNTYISGDQITVHFYLENESKVNVELMNLLGEKLGSFEDVHSSMNNGIASFELSRAGKKIIPGIYIIRLIANGKSFAKKVVVE